MKKITVNLNRNSDINYDIYIGKQLIGEIAKGIVRMANATANTTPATSLPLIPKTAIISDDNVMGIHGESLIMALNSTGIEPTVISFPAGESSKNIATVIEIAKRLLIAGIDRHSTIIAFGGGVVGDIASFVASIYMRGITCIQIPTTLIAQTDSSIGGKTGVDLPEGKNLLGTFFQPAAVFIDVRFLETLAARDFSNGMAEVIKYGLIADGELFSHIEGSIAGIMHRESSLLVPLIETCCRIKKGIVEVDEKERGVRRFLNFGHTLGHAVEAASNYQISHGEAVSLGMMAALKISSKRQAMPIDIFTRLERVLWAAGLPTRLPPTVAIPAILDKIKADKKKAGTKNNFVLLSNISAPLIDSDVPEKLLSTTLEDLRK